MHFFPQNEDIPIGKFFPKEIYFYKNHLAIMKKVQIHVLVKWHYFLTK